MNLLIASLYIPFFNVKIIASDIVFNSSKFRLFSYIRLSVMYRCLYTFLQVSIAFLTMIVWHCENGNALFKVSSIIWWFTAANNWIDVRWWDIKLGSGAFSSIGPCNRIIYSVANDWLQITEQPTGLLTVYRSLIKPTLILQIMFYMYSREACPKYLNDIFGSFSSMYFDISI